MQDPESWLSHNRFSYCMHNPVMYTDPNGEYCLIDDLLAMGLGGVVNVVSNLVSGNIHSFGQGCAYFGIGAVSAEVSLYASPIVGGSLLGGANSALTSYIQTGSVNGQSMAMGAFMGGATSYLGSIVGGKASAWISKWTGKLASPILKSWLPQAFGGSASGFTLSTGMSLLNGESLETALKEGGKGAASGFAIGSLTGIAHGFKNAKSENVSPWTGKTRTSEQTTEALDQTAPRLVPDNDGNYTVYEGIDPVTGEVKYVGITKRDPQVRFNEHLRSNSPRAGLEYRVITGASGLSKTNAHVWEQNLINQYGLSNLYNQINSIAPKYWNQYNIKP